MAVNCFLIFTEIYFSEISLQEIFPACRHEGFYLTSNFFNLKPMNLHLVGAA